LPLITRLLNAKVGEFLVHAVLDLSVFELTAEHGAHAGDNLGTLSRVSSANVNGLSKNLVQVSLGDTGCAEASKVVGVKDI
jgi:hypothetical protein